MRCSSEVERSQAAVVAGLEQFSKELPGGPLCLHSAFSPRNPAVAEPPGLLGSWIEGDPPAQFADLASQPPATANLAAKALASRLPAPWHLRTRGDDLCFELTAPVVDGDRGVVSIEVRGDRSLAGRRTYWLHWRSGAWNVEAITTGRSNF